MLARSRQVAVACTIGWLLAALPAAAQERRLPLGFIHELKIGVLAHDVPEFWSHFQRERYGPDLNIEALLSPSVDFLGGTIRPAIGGTFNFRGDTSKGYLDARWQRDTALGIFFGLGFGVAVHDGNLKATEVDRKALGTRVLFHTQFEVGYRIDRHQSISIFYDHISNASIKSENEGLDTLGLRYGYRF
jgi:lipid A 3-O-deacylase